MKSNVYFAASNTSEGFTDRFGDVFFSGAAERRFIIKGGPGTGKSTLMKKAAERAVKCGLSVEKFFCSSDPSSLDGLIIPDVGAAFLDGTSPHLTDGELPGACDTLVDLGRFWDADILYMKRKEIKELSDRSALCFRQAYTYLRAAKSVCSGIRSALISAQTEKAAKKLTSIIPRLTVHTRGNTVRRSRQISAMSCKGHTVLDTFFENAVHIYAVDASPEFGDVLPAAQLFLTSLLYATDSADVSADISRGILFPAEPDALFYPDSGICVSGCPVPERFAAKTTRIAAERFADTEVLRNARATLRFERKCTAALTGACADSLAKAKAYHDELEALYIGCMDFEKKEKFTEALLDSLF